MVKIPAGAGASGSAKEMCIRRFVEWWTPYSIRSIMSKLDPGAGSILESNGIANPDTIAGFLYDMVGPHFLREMDDDRAKRRAFLLEILTAATKNGHVREADIIRMAADKAPNARAQTISDVVQLDMTAKLCKGLAHELGLPPSVALKERTESPSPTEVVEPHTPLNPLYDYQHSTGKMVRNMLEGKYKDAQGREIIRRLIAVPTGSGKTRMIVQTLVEWLNDEKTSSSPQRKNSKFILWVAQSGELCEQALSAFRSVFESVGRRGTTLHLHRFWGSGGSLPNIGMDDMLDERGVIVATIQSLHKVLSKQPRLLEKLGKLTSCIVVDEAHHSVTSSYSAVLSKMGFNWHNRKTEISERGIVLIGLTATPFRGRGDSEETQRLKRWYGDIHFPTIPYIKDSANYKPHALIDCQTSALAGEYVHILGEQSYDRDGFIRETDYFWTIRRLGPGVSANADTAGHRDQPDWTRRDEWTLQGDRNVSFKFEHPGTYEITLRVVDNEGDPGETSTKIEIIEHSEEAEDSESERQRRLYRSLVSRKVLCKVYHHVMKVSGTVGLDEKDEKHLETFGEFRSETLKSIGENPERNNTILREIVRLGKKGRKKILFFGCSVEHSRRMALYLKMQEIKAHYVDSKMGIDSRVEAIRDFRESDLGVLCNFGVLTTGFDAPNIDCVFVGRPVRSTLLYTQMIGRGMRGTKSGGTKDVLIVDIDDNLQLRNQTKVNLGWKIFEPDWERWEETDSAWSSDIPRKEVTEPAEAVPRASRPDPRRWPSSDGTSEPAATLVPEHTCSACGDRAVGIENIKETFDIGGPLEIVAGYLKDGKNGELPSECHRCKAEKGGSLVVDGGRGSEPAGAVPTDSNTHVSMDAIMSAEVKTHGSEVLSQDSASGASYRPAPEVLLTPTSEQLLWSVFDHIITVRKNTHKFALAACLLHHANREDTGPTLRYADIAAAFLRCYWHQVIKYNVKQNSHDRHPPRAVAIIHKRFKGYRGELADAPAEVVQRTISEILQTAFGPAKNNTATVIPKFQMIYSGGAIMEKRVFYEYSDAKKVLTLRPEAIAFFRKNRTALLGRVFVGWARFLEKVNPPGKMTAGVRSYLERQGAPIDDVEPVKNPSSTSCFACEVEIGRGGIRLYSLMPWSYVFENEGWPPVPLCKACRDIAWDGQADRALIERLVGYTPTHPPSGPTDGTVTFT